MVQSSVCGPVVRMDGFEVYWWAACSVGEKEPSQAVLTDY